MRAAFILLHPVAMLVTLLSFSTALAAPRNVTAETTFYGAKDNCPPGGDISYPKLHKLAGGNGTYHDPITYAGYTGVTPAGTIIYVHNLQKYFIMEDDCQECREEYKKNQHWHVDLWMGPTTVSAGPELVACENHMTKDKALITIDPPNSYHVNVAPLFANGKCIETAQPCHDVGNTCGNTCEIPKTATCDELAKMFMLPMTRFKQLNPKLDCSKSVPSGHTVCMGGTCGD